MGMNDNPSADKFGPPGQERFEAPKPRRGPQWFGLLFLAVLWLSRIALDHVPNKGWTSGLVLLGLLGIGIADYVVRRKLRDARRADGGDPYTPPHNITR